MIHNFLFMDEAEAASIGTSSHKNPTFHLYESGSLQSVGLCNKIQHNSYPRYLPRPYDINSIQAIAVRLALVQYFDNKGWKPNMSVRELVRSGITKKSSSSSPNKKYAGGFIIGDGTGVGKTRELAAFLTSVVLYEKAMQDATVQFGPTIFGQDSSSVINAVNKGSWKRSPFFIWMTCSRALFNSCQEGMREVVTNSKFTEDGSWHPFPDKPSYFSGGGKCGSIAFATKNYKTGDTEETHIRLYTLSDVKEYAKGNRGSSISRVVDFFTAAPTVLFMTYADLNVNLEFVLNFITEGTNIDSNIGPIETFVTAMICDEFHKPKNISDAFRGELEKIWAEEDKRVLSNSPQPPTPSISEVVRRFKTAISKDRQFSVKRLKSKKENTGIGLITTSSFLSLLRQSDSFRLLLEVVKYDTFTVMASATPFQSNADLHSIDHILRRNVPAYTSIAAFSGAGNSTTPDAIAENSEYSTLFLEQVVKLLRNRGQLVSRCISIENVECSVVNCNTSPLQKYAIDELSTYCLNARQVLIDSKQLGIAIGAIFYPYTINGQVAKTHIQQIINVFNSLNTVSEENITTSRKCQDEEENLKSLVGKMDKRFRAIMVKDEDVAHDGNTTLNTILKEAANAASEKMKKLNKSNSSRYFDDDISPEGLAATELLNIMEEEEVAAATTSIKTTNNVEMIFGDEWFEKLRRQYFINTASISVAACKSALLSVKARTVADAVKRFRMSPSPRKAVMSLEQTGDSFLTSLANRIFCAPSSCNFFKKKKKRKIDPSAPRHGIVDVNVFDASPLANTIFAGYRLLCRAVAMATAVKLKTDNNKVVYLMLMPAPPPVEPLVALAGNSLDTIVQSVGEANHAEITNRKLSSRITQRGMMIIRSNPKTSNTIQCINSFNNTKAVDVIMLGPKGNTGLSLHDSKSNTVSAKRIHCLLDLPYNAISFLQTIGRTHRNGQLSVPQFLIFSTDSPAERRFFDSLENRVKDSKAGTFADRYSSNSISITNSVNREQFLDKGLVLKTVGSVIRIIASDLSPVKLINIFSKMMVDIGEDVSAFVEGLNSSNNLFVEILILALHITLVILGRQLCIRCPERLCKALNFVSILNNQSLYAIASSASKIVFSNMCLNLVYHQTPSQKDERLQILADAASDLIKEVNSYDIKTKKSALLLLPAEERDSSVYVFSDLVSPLQPFKNNKKIKEEQKPKTAEESILQIVSSHKPQKLKSAIKSSSTVVTVRILGSGKKQGVLPVTDCIGSVTTDMLQLIPVVAASSVINTLSKENPGLVLKLYNASAPHRHFRYPYYNTSYILGLAWKLSTGSLDFRQFQNNFFSPKDESELMLETFSNVKSIMARDERLDGLCETRMNSVMGASYVNVRKKPECVFISKLLGPNLKRHVASDEDSDIEDGEEDGEKKTGDIAASTGEGHNLDIILCNGKTVTLTKENSAFVKEHIDSFVAGNVIGDNGKILQLCFDNCEGSFIDMPKFCLYDPLAESYQANECQNSV